MRLGTALLLLLQYWLASLVAAPPVDISANDLRLRVARFQERHRRMSEERSLLQRRYRDLVAELPTIERDLQVLRANQAFRGLLAALAQENRDIASDLTWPLLNASAQRTSGANNRLNRHAMTQDPQLRLIVLTAGRYENIRLQMLSQIQQLDTAGRIAVERWVKVVDQLTQLGRSAESQQREFDQLQLGYWDVTDVAGRYGKSELDALLEALAPVADDNPAAFVARAWARRHIGRVAEQVMADYDAAIAAGGNFLPVALAAKGEWLVSQGQPRDGWRMLTEAQRSSPDSPDGRVLCLVAHTHTLERDWKQAEDAWKRLLQQGQFAATAHRNLCLSYSGRPGGREAKVDQAVLHGELARDLSLGEDWTCLDALAIAKGAAGEFGAATELARQAAELASDEKRTLCEEHARRLESRERVWWEWTSAAKPTKPSRAAFSR